MVSQLTIKYKRLLDGLKIAIDPLCRGSKSWKNSAPLMWLTVTYSLRQESRRGRSTEGGGEEGVGGVSGGDGLSARVPV